ncbi:hypothetical protein M3197_01490 [Sporosarcina aquimarina]|uniref:hypothetical protein n=1 Tax=Sporosarcina aquimarina TaxID=114975 RepID=UPI00203B70C0|nr:hypothetical protein [Sporosarcina aquimarina]MCM3756148.1 hypothetical protein [Sporosarcina aquimarina]
MKTKFVLIFFTAFIMLSGCSKDAEPGDEQVTSVAHEDDKNSGEKEIEDEKKEN